METQSCISFSSQMEKNTAQLATGNDDLNTNEEKVINMWRRRRRRQQRRLR